MTDDNEIAARTVSERSTISDTADSSGGGLVVVPYETPTQTMATEFIGKVMNVWGERVPLSFAPRDTANSTYLTIVHDVPTTTLMKVDNPETSLSVPITTTPMNIIAC